MNDSTILYKLLDFEVNWNKFHLIKQQGYILRIQQLNDIFDKLDISFYQQFQSSTNSNVNQINAKASYNYIKTGQFLNNIPTRFLQGVDLKIKNKIQNSKLLNKYPHFNDFQFDYQCIFIKLFSLRCSIYKLEEKFKFDFENSIQNVELELENLFHQNLINKVGLEIKELDSILIELINPLNKFIHSEDVLHNNLDFGMFKYN